MKQAVKGFRLNIAARLLSLIPQRVPVLLSGRGIAKLLPSELATLGARKPLLLFGESFVSGTESGTGSPDLEARRTILSILESAGIPFAVFDRISSLPDREGCAHALEFLRSSACDAIVAAGDGTLFDAAKFIRIAATHRGGLARIRGILPFRQPGLPLVCLPTVAGSGSEACPVSFIRETPGGHVTFIFDPRLSPDTVILDPSLCKGRSARDTAFEGMEAFSLAVEAFLGSLHYSDVEVQAIEAVRLMFSALPAACRNPEDLEAREMTLRAAHLAGRAYGRGFAGYSHAISMALHERYGLSRGEAAVFVLPKVLELHRAFNSERLEELEGAPGIAAAQGGFIEAFAGLKDAIGLDAGRQGLIAGDIPELVAAIAKKVHESRYPLPFTLDREGLDSLLRSMLVETR
jgi:alcohol dehydrogenase class IV